MPILDLMAQISHPAGDVAVGYWSNEAGQILSLFASIDEGATAIDTDYVKSADPPTDDICKFALAGIAIPQAGDVKVRIRARWGVPSAVGSDVAFVWDAVATATNYILQIGTGIGQSNIFNSSVGNVLTYHVSLTPGTYYSRVAAYNGAIYLSTTTPDQTVTVT